MKLTTVKTELPSWYHGGVRDKRDNQVKVVVIAAGQCAIIYIDWDEVRHLMTDQDTWETSAVFLDAVEEGKARIKELVHKQLAELDGE
jgi:translation elongation factor P/translation initiation factor 5A